MSTSLPNRPGKCGAHKTPYHWAIYIWQCNTNKQSLSVSLNIHATKMWPFVEWFMTGLIQVRCFASLWELYDAYDDVSRGTVAPESTSATTTWCRNFRQIIFGSLVAQCWTLKAFLCTSDSGNHICVHANMQDELCMQNSCVGKPIPLNDINETTTLKTQANKESLEQDCGVHIY